ncbi:MAG TPA: hypothetical protein VGM64_13310 [Lacunisphaera sp.]|jgi:hypothetical protein
MADPVPVFTASRIAEIAGQDRKTIRDQLDVDQARPIQVKGQATQAWPVSALPATLRAHLQSLSEKHGYSDVTRFLENGRSRWQPNIPVGKIAPHHVATAKKRCAVFAPIVQAHRTAPITEIAELAQAAWKTSSGYPITERTIRRWIERAVDRDRGFEDWTRWAIYLDDDISSAAPLHPATAATVFGAVRLEEAIDAISEPHNPSPEDRSNVWLQAMIEADKIAGQEPKENLARDIVLTVLRRAQIPLAKNFGEALTVAYRRKRTRWIECGRVPSAIADLRPTNNKDRRWELPESDRTLLLRYFKNTGDIASAWRMARTNKALTAETIQRFTDNPSDKSYVPNSIRAALGSDPQRIDELKIGPRNAKLACGWIERDHSGYAPGDWWQGDDLTPPVYFWHEEQGIPVLTRGQIVMMIDCRTTHILGWVLGSDRNYNSRQIRHLITLCHDLHGLPRKGFYFERGIWKNSRVLKGKVNQTIVGMEETETGLREFGLDFRHALTPREKLIERVFGLLQNRMESVRGYCGRNEMKDCPEKVREWKLNVESGRNHPREYFLHKEDWNAEIERIVADYNGEKHGRRAKLIPRQSPSEAYQGRTTSDVVWLPLGCRHLLAHHRLTVIVTRNGIRLPSGSLGGGLYRNEATGSVIGQKVLVSVNPDDLSYITMLELDRSNPRLVERANPLAAFSDYPSEISATTAQLRAHNRHGQNIYRIVSAGEKPEAFRPVRADRKTIEVGAEMTRQAAERKDQARFVSDGRRFVESESVKSGLPIRAGNTPDKIARQREAAELRREALREIERERGEKAAEEIS